MIDHTEDQCEDCYGSGSVVIEGSDEPGDYDEDNCQCECHWP